MINNELIKVEHLYAKSRTKKIYENINFKVKAGEVVGLLGHNGAGKSTMLRNLANLEKPDLGKVYINGELLSINKFNTDVILVPDTIELIKNLTIKENLFIIKENYGYDKEFFNKYLEQVNLNLEDTVGELSKGNQEIVQLIILLSLNTKVVLLDEPFSAIDIFRRELILTMIVDVVSKEEKLIIITTHLINEIEKILTKIFYLDNGKIVIDKTIEEIEENYSSLVEYLKEYFSSEVNQSGIS